MIQGLASTQNGLFFGTHSRGFSLFRGSLTLEDDISRAASKLSSMCCVSASPLLRCPRMTQTKRRSKSGRFVTKTSSGPMFPQSQFFCYCLSIETLSVVGISDLGVSILYESFLLMIEVYCVLTLQYLMVDDYQQCMYFLVPTESDSLCTLTSNVHHDPSSIVVILYIQTLL